jgi:hypothetical protein
VHYSESDCIALLRCASMAGYPALRGLPHLGEGENPNLALFERGRARPARPSQSWGGLLSWKERALATPHNAECGRVSLSGVPLSRRPNE